MSIEKNIEIDQITVTAEGVVMVREVTKYIENGNEISKSYHRASFDPGADVSGQNDKVKQICQAVWTPEVVAAYQAIFAQA
jgi:hypothetical protein